MAKKKKKKPLPPRRTRMKREGRLQSAKTWIKKYEGKKIVKAYKKHYNVDWVCAFIELEMLGVPICEDYKNNVLRMREVELEARRRRKAERLEKERLEKEMFDSLLWSEDILYVGDGCYEGIDICDECDDEISYDEILWDKLLEEDFVD